jgi:Outer membrane protein beta-barrel family/Carboxypeptidase regulatory-like domain
MKKYGIQSTCRATTALIFLFFVFAQYSIAQTNIHGIVTDSAGKPLAGANVLLLKAADSSLVKGMFTNETGSYLFRSITNGKYLIASTHTGFHQTFSSTLEVAGNTEKTEMASLVLRAETHQLAEVTVTAKKPLLEQKIDRLIINVANSITSAGNTALEVLERSPGVIVDHQNNLISMNGKNGVVVMINGKISRMPVSAIVQLLSGMSAGNIEKIELITTPPANFDAEGNAGYINIILKENNNYGTNGSFSITVGYTKGIISQNSININHRKEKINLFGDLSYSLFNRPLLAAAGARFLNQSTVTETFMTANRRETVGNINGRAGVDIQLSNHTILGVLLSGYDNHYAQHENNQNLKYKNGQLDTVMKLNNNEINHWSNYSANINLQHTCNKEDKVSVNLDYIWYSNNQPVNYSTDFYNGASNFLYNQQYRSGKITPIHFWVGAVDFNNQLSKNISMEAGLKETISNFDNDISFERLKPGGYEKDSALSANYKLKESYSAAYTSFNITISKKTSAKLGLRYEYTNSNLGTLVTKNIVDRHYGSLFPSFFLSHQLNEKNAVNFSYSRRITRPTFNDLAPFTYYVDANTLLTGNPALQPSFSNTVKFDYIFSKYYFSVSYSKEDNAIARFQPSTDSVTSKLILSATNLINQKTIVVAISVPITVTKWWSMQYNFTGLWQQVNAIYQKAPVRLEQSNFQMNGNMNFTLPKAYSIELSGFYQSKSLSGIFVVKPLGSLDFGIKKKMPDKKGAFVFSVSNIFNTIKFRAYSDIPEKNLNSNIDIQFTQRMYKLTYTRSFGKDKLKQTRDRSTGAEDEKGRVQQN